MVLRTLILISLVVSAVSALADTAADYAHRGAQKYIFDDKKGARQEIDHGLQKFPLDPELRRMTTLFSEKDQNQQQQGNGEQKDQQEKQQDKKIDTQSSPTPSNKRENKDQQKDSDKRSELGENPSPIPNASPSQSPGSTPQPSASASPGKGDSSKNSDDAKHGETPSPTPSESEGKGDSPSPSPTQSPQKRDGDFKNAGEEQPSDASNANEEGAAPVDKPGEMSEREAELLLQATKDEEARVQLDERKARRRVYNDW